MREKLKNVVSDVKDSWAIAKAARDGKTIITNSDGSYTIIVSS